ncbi:MAG: hypothetical protein V1659_00855 [Candidatus Woesearchaeota archaeon]
MLTRRMILRVLHFEESLDRVAADLAQRRKFGFQPRGHINEGVEGGCDRVVIRADEYIEVRDPGTGATFYVRRTDIKKKPYEDQP